MIRSTYIEQPSPMTVVVVPKPPDGRTAPYLMTKEEAVRFLRIDVNSVNHPRKTRRKDHKRHTDKPPAV